ncbi:GNAT family N-acetyltransferase [Nocardia sp. NBC_01327]|uniref:GNAT family N-acetyltransferase n=1 Tax=Nocardia sp. NBC_01327 TaxID=2903593 RepID=UPI002E0F5E92|nr:GNAT family N-acetyltransferase [Nocardia sp. NBC_01327]
MSSVFVRPAEAADEKFLWSMLFEASYSQEQGRVSPDELRAVPSLAHYVEGWGAAGDLGTIGEVDGVPRGAAWLRLFTGDNAAYGYVDDGTPELAIGVAPGMRGTGLGTALMTALLDAARPLHDAVSLSVREENPALRLYERLGFVAVPSSAHTNPAGSTSVTMVLRFR